MSFSQLDAPQIIREAYDPVTGAYKVKIVGGSISVSSGLNVISSHEILAASIPNSVSAPFEITASLPTECKQVVIYETTGETLQFRIGATTGTLLYYIGPGQDTPVDSIIASGTRVTVRSNGSAPTAGSLLITFLG